MSDTEEFLKDIKRKLRQMELRQLEMDKKNEEATNMLKTKLDELNAKVK